MSSIPCPGALQSNSSSSDNVCFSTNCQVQPGISFQLKTFFFKFEIGSSLICKGRSGKWTLQGILSQEGTCGKEAGKRPDVFIKIDSSSRSWMKSEIQALNLYNDEKLS